MSETFAQAVKKAREMLGWSQQALADAAKTTQSTIDRIESGSTTYSRAAPRVAIALGIPFMLSGRSEGSPIAIPIAPPDDDLARSQRTSSSAPDEVPVFAAAEGGSGSMVIESAPIDYAPRPEPLKSAADGYLVYVVGDSMAPAFRPGERAIVNQHHSDRKAGRCLR